MVEGADSASEVSTAATVEGTVINYGPRNWGTESTLGAVEGPAFWEYEERNAWKATNVVFNSFLEEMWSLCVKQCQMGLDDEGKEKYEWIIPERRQLRKHLIDGEWKTVKTRRIRRVRVCVGPTTLAHGPRALPLG